MVSACFVVVVVVVAVVVVVVVVLVVVVVVVVVVVGCWLLLLFYGSPWQEFLGSIIDLHFAATKKSYGETLWERCSRTWMGHLIPGSLKVISLVSFPQRPLL